MRARMPDRVKMLVSLWQDGTRPSREVKAIALEQVIELDARVVELTAMRDGLLSLARACHGDGRPECPILENLGRASSAGQRPDPPPRTSGKGQKFGIAR